MKEFMLLIRNTADSKSAFTAAEDVQFLKACEVYIDTLVKGAHLISAQPLVREGAMVSGTPGHFATGAYSAGAEVIVGYYHILATGIEQAIEIAKGNPEFAYTTTARVEVRPIKTKETATAYVYPQGQ